MARPFHEHAIYKVSSLGRPVDPRFPSNKAILVVMTLAVAVGTGAYWLAEPRATASVSQSLVHGLLWGGVTFVAWALGRELDPDRPHSAMLGVAAALAVLIGFGDADLHTLAGALAVARLTNRTIGPGARVTDLMLVVALLGATVWFEGRWPLALAGAAALGLDAVLEHGTRDRWIWAALVLAPLIALVATRGLMLQLPSEGLATTAGIVVASIGIATLPPLRSSCDLPGHALAYRRVQAGMFVVLLLTTLARFEVSATPRGLGAAAVLLAAILGRVVFRTPTEP